MISMARQFWNEENTRGSLEVLRRLAGKLDLVLIGGWAVNFYTGKQKSLDVDIAIGYSAIEYFRQFGISQYDGLNIKYSVIDSVCVDLFIEQFADRDLPFPVSEIMENYVTIDNIKVVERSLLLLLKLWGYFRSDREKHTKDIIDALSLLLYAGIDMARVKEQMDRYGIPARRAPDVIMEYLDIGDTLLDYLEMGKEEYDRLKSKYRADIKRIF